jgi:hypothetical protein
VRHAKKEVFSLVRVSRTIAKSIEINSFSFYKKTLLHSSNICRRDVNCVVLRVGCTKE